MEDSQRTTVHQVWSSLSYVGLSELTLREIDFFFFPKIGTEHITNRKRTI